jgi:hypothetical protein
MLLEGRRDELGLVVRRHAAESDEYDPSVCKLALVHQLAKVLVRGEQQRAQLVCAVEDVFVALLRSELGDVEDIETVFSQSSDDVPVDALVDDNYAASSPGNG